MIRKIRVILIVVVIRNAGIYPAFLMVIVDIIYACYVNAKFQTLILLKEERTDGEILNFIIQKTAPDTTPVQRIMRDSEVLDAIVQKTVPDIFPAVHHLPGYNSHTEDYLSRKYPPHHSSGRLFDEYLLQGSRAPAC